MQTPLAATLAAAYSAVVRYAAEKEMSTLNAMVASAKEGERNGDALPRKVLADYLEENGLHHDEETLTHLRSEPGQHDHGINIHLHTNGEHAGKVEAAPHLREPHNFDNWNSHGDSWDTLPPHQQRHWSEVLGEASDADDHLTELVGDRYTRQEIQADAAASAAGDPTIYAAEIRRAIAALDDAI